VAVPFRNGKITVSNPVAQTRIILSISWFFHSLQETTSIVALLRIPDQDDHRIKSPNMKVVLDWGY